LTFNFQNYTGDYGDWATPSVPTINVQDAFSTPIASGGGPHMVIGNVETRILDVFGFDIGAAVASTE
jgi:hypothetical protein